MVRHCDLTSHCSLLLLGQYEWGASPLLFCTVIWCLTRRPGFYMSHMSATGSTEFMKGSIDGGVYYRIHERERLSFKKSVFTEYVPTRVYRVHLKTFIFPFDKSQFYYTSSSTITCWISRCVRSPDASSVKRKLTNACTSSWKFSGHSCIRSN